MIQYYVYVSETKVSFLYSQIPTKLRKRIATTLTIDLKLIRAEFSGREPQESLFSKLKVVERYLFDAGEVGSVDNPSAYFHGNLPLRWGPLAFQPYEGERGEIVYFRGETQRTVLGLGGSIHHVMGNTSGSAPVRSGSATPLILAGIKGNLPEDAYSQNILGTMSILSAVESLHLAETVSAETTSEPERMDFLARRLAAAPNRNGPGTTLLGTPIYVALADE